jgi:hypothetical protein
MTASSCKKVIDLDLRDASGQLVIEGNVTNTAGPQYVRISRNVPFTDPNNYPAVSGATVSISDSLGNTYPLTESPAGTYSNKQLTGVDGQTYSLSVTTGGKTYTAKSKMPQTVVLDSIASKAAILNSGGDKRLISVYFKDPAGVPNQYRFILTVNGIQVKAIFSFDDEFIDGRDVTLDLQQTDIDIHPGDTVTVEMQCIDKPVYKYWFALSQEQADNPGGQVAPANPTTNITPATLGYFSAHTTQVLTLAVK